MLNFIKNLTVFQVVLINIALISINVIFTFIFKGLVKNKYNKTKSVEETLYFQFKISKYVQTILIFVTSFISAFIITPKARGLGDINGFLVVMGVLFGIMILIYSVQHFIMHDLNTMLRKTTSSKGEKIKLLIRGLLFAFIPMVFFFAVVMVIDNRIHVNPKWEGILKTFLIAIVYLIFSIVSPFFIRYMIKAVPMEDGEVKEGLKSFLDKSGLPQTKLYLWPTKKNKVANAMVSGLTTKNVYITDYLLENFDMEETKSVLAHESGHIKRYHLWIRTGLFLGVIIIFPGIGSLFDWYELHYREIPIWFGLSVMGVIFILYMGFFLYFIKRVQERQADEYVLQLNVQPEVYIRALYKLTKLNNMVMKFGKLDEKFQTHPSTAQRIKWIMEKAKIEEAALEAIKISMEDTLLEK